MIVYRGDVTFWHFIYFGLFNGAIMSLSMPARAAVVPEIVPERIMVNAMAPAECHLLRGAGGRTRPGRLADRVVRGQRRQRGAGFIHHSRRHRALHHRRHVPGLGGSRRRCFAIGATPRRGPMPRCSTTWQRGFATWAGNGSFLGCSSWASCR